MFEIISIGAISVAMLIWNICLLVNNKNQEKKIENMVKALMICCTYLEKANIEDETTRKFVKRTNEFISQYLEDNVKEKN